MEKLNKVEKVKFLENMKYSNRLAYLIISFNQGLGSISELAVQFYFKDDLHIEPARLSQIYSLILIPWTIKPLFGMITDLFPICGYRRKIYIMLCGIFCILSWLSMSLYVNSLFGAILCLLTINICISFSTVLGEAIVVELSQLEKVNASSSAKDYVSMFFFCKYFGALISSYLKGLFVEIMSIRSVFLIASILPWLIVTAGYILIEIKVKEEEKNFDDENECLNHNDNVYVELKNDYNKAEKLGKNAEEKIIILKNKQTNYDTFEKKNNNKINFGIEDEKEGLKTASTSNNLNVPLIEENFPQNNKEQVEILNVQKLQNEKNSQKNDVEKEQKGIENENNDDSFHSIFHPKPKPSPIYLLREFTQFICQKYVLIPTLFIIMLMATPSYGDPYFYFLTNVLKFSASSLGKISFCSTAATLLAIWLYKTYFKDCNFKIMITYGTIISFIVSFMAYLLVQRVNLQLGISDFWFVLFSSSFLSMIGELVMMPMLALACLLCPKNLEGTVYALFMSALNFGGILSGLFGSFLTSYLNITSQDYTNLHTLISISNILTLLPLPFLLIISDSYFEPKEKDNTEQNQQLFEKEKELNYDYNNFDEEKKHKNMEDDNEKLCLVKAKN